MEQQRKRFLLSIIDENFIPLEFGITQLPETFFDKNLITNNNLIDGYNNVNGSLQSNEAYSTTRLIRIVDNVTSVFTNAFQLLCIQQMACGLDIGVVKEDVSGR